MYCSNEHLNTIHLLDRSIQEQSGLLLEDNCFTHRVALFPGFMLTLPLQTSVAPSFLAFFTHPPIQVAFFLWDILLFLLNCSVAVILRNPPALSL